MIYLHQNKSMVIQLSDVLAEGVIKQLSVVFATNFENNYGEFSIEIPTNLGQGSVRGINFPNGVGLLIFDMKLTEELVLKFMSQAVQPLRMAFVVKSSLQHTFSNETEAHNMTEHDSALLGSKGKHGHEFLFPKDKQIKAILLSVDRQEFVNQLTFPVSDMDELFRTILADTFATKTVFHYTPYSLHIANVFDELNEYDKMGLQRTTFLGSKGLELLTYSFTLYQDDARNEETRTEIRKHEVEKIKAVVNQIEQDLQNLPVITKLAKDQKLTEAKLQQGFKLLFKKTVNEYIQSERLSRAMTLLQTTDKTIDDVAYSVGLRSRSYFSQLFKEKYGVSPGKVRK